MVFHVNLLKIYIKRFSTNVEQFYFFVPFLPFREWKRHPYPDGMSLLLARLMMHFLQEQDQLSRWEQSAKLIRIIHQLIATKKIPLMAENNKILNKHHILKFLSRSSGEQNLNILTATGSLGSINSTEATPIGDWISPEIVGCSNKKYKVQHISKNFKKKISSFSNPKYKGLLIRVASWRYGVFLTNEFHYNFVAFHKIHLICNFQHYLSHTFLLKS